MADKPQTNPCVLCAGEQREGERERESERKREQRAIFSHLFQGSRDTFPLTEPLAPAVTAGADMLF